MTIEGAHDDRLERMTAGNEVFAPRRVGAMVLRFLFLMRNSWPRLVEMVYWPTMQMILWGFMTKFLATNSSWVVQAAGVLISGVLLWDILYRGQLGVSLMFLEEMFARNLGHLFVSPLRIYEMAASLLVMSLLRTLVSFLGASALAIPLYHFSIFTLGFPMVLFFFTLIITGWSIGLAVSGLVMRFGLGAESLAWVAIFAIYPFTAVYYPVSVLPGWLHPVAWAIPASHVFEGMRALMIEGVFRTDLLRTAMLLNVVYLAVGFGIFLAAFHGARQRGLLLDVGE